MSMAEMIIVKAQVLPEPAQTAVLQLVELLAGESRVDSQTPIQPGSAKGRVTVAEDFDTPPADFEPYMLPRV
jgi:hypothetical protein